MGPFWQALAFLTRLPVPARPFNEEDWEKSPLYYPVVGVVLGLLLWGAASALLFLFSDRLAAALLLVIWTLLTGGLHADGWIDVADGIGSHRSPERVREIMKDSRVGAMGTLAAVLLLLVKWASLADLLSARQLVVWLLLPPWVARLALLFAIRFWPYASENGIGQKLARRLSVRMIVVHAAALFACGWALGGWGALWTIGLSLAVGLAGVGWLSRKLNGMTGDGYGATVEGVETVVLLFILAMERGL